MHQNPYSEIPLRLTVPNLTVYGFLTLVSHPSSIPVLSHIPTHIPPWSSLTDDLNPLGKDMKNCC